MIGVPLHVIHLDQDDPKKCTARKLEARGQAKLHLSVKLAPRRGFLLNPNAETILGPEDRGMTDIGGSLVALDCSWKNISQSLEIIHNRTSLEGRRLPSLLAANPVSWGKLGRLSTVEALAGSLVILGHFEQAKEILRGFPFGNRFLDLNKEPLEAYSSVVSRDDLESVQSDFFY